MKLELADVMDLEIDDENGAWMLSARKTEGTIRLPEGFAPMLIEVRWNETEWTNLSIYRQDDDLIIERWDANGAIWKHLA